MLKALFKKQLLELKHLYFMSSQSGKQRSKNQMTLLALLLVVLLFGSAFAFVGLSEGLGTLFIPQDLGWLYFGLMGLFALIIATFISAVSCYAQLFRAKDNELLLSMPIPPRLILLVRITVTYLLSFVFVAVAWLPAIFEYLSLSARFGISVDSTAMPLALIAWPFIALLATVFACIIGWIIAALSNKIRHKSIVASIAIAALIVGYFIAYSYFMASFQESLEQGNVYIPADLLDTLQQNVWLLAQLGLAATGSVNSLLCFAGISVLLFVLIYAVMTKSFKRIATGYTKAGQKTSFSIDRLKAHSIKQALYKREVSRFVSSSAYLVNCGLGIVFILVLTIAALINAEIVSQIIDELYATDPLFVQCIPAAMTGIIIALIGMDAVTAPSISLEGKNLWILRSLPVDPHLIMNAKIRLHLVVGLAPSVLCLITLGVLLEFDVASLILCVLCVSAFVWLHATFGLAMNLRMPKLSWPHETVPIKQSMPVFLSMMLGWIMAVVIIFACFGLAEFLDPRLIMLLFTLVFTGAAIAINHWIRTSGVQRFEEL